MKKVVKRIVLIFLVILFLQFILYLFKNNHEIKYKIKDKEKNFVINEIFENNKYYFNIDIDDYHFSFDYSNKFYKSKKVIEKVEYYEIDNMLCIYPVLKKDNYFNIICSKEKKIYYYNIFNGIKTIMEYEEFNFNKVNRYAVYKK